MEKDELEASKSTMALFDDNYGKDFANATLWLEASEADRDYDESGGYYSGGGCTDSGCFIMFVLFAVFVIIPSIIITALAYLL